jgi:hypothetical protein
MPAHGRRNGGATAAQRWLLIGGGRTIAATVYPRDAREPIKKGISAVHVTEKRFALAQRCAMLRAASFCF